MFNRFGRFKLGTHSRQFLGYLQKLVHRIIRGVGVFPGTVVVIAAFRTVAAFTGNQHRRQLGEILFQLIKFLFQFTRGHIGFDNRILIKFGSFVAIGRHFITFIGRIRQKKLIKGFFDRARLFNIGNFALGNFFAARNGFFFFILVFLTRH